MTRRVFALAALAFGLAACGRKAPLRAPEGAPSTYPRAYPPGAPKDNDEDRL